MSFQDWIRKLKTGPSQPTRLIPEPSRTGYATSFDGTQIYWEHHGPEFTPHCKPMIFSYGLVCSMNQWRYQLERYSVDHPCLLLDYRGHHQSETPQDDHALNLSALARDMAAVIEAQHFSGPYHIWGHSMGCSVALEYAVAFPERALTLNLCCGTLDNPFKHMFHSNFLEKITTPALNTVSVFPDLFYNSWEALLLRPEMAKFIVRWLGFNPKASTPEDVQTYVQAVSSCPPRTFFHLLTDLSRGTTRGIAPKVKTPTCVIAGSMDHITPIESQRSMASTLPDAVYVEIPVGSHNVQLDFGEYVCLKVEEVWKKRNLW